MDMLHLSFLDLRILSQKPPAFRENNFFFFFYVKQEHKQLRQTFINRNKHWEDSLEAKAAQEQAPWNSRLNPDQNWEHDQKNQQ